MTASRVAATLAAILIAAAGVLLGYRLAVRRTPMRAVPESRGEPLSFPRDHGAHAGAISEWWYFNGHLSGGGRHLGYYLSFFETSVGLHCVHVGIVDEDAMTHACARVNYPSGQVHVRSGALELTYGPQSVRRSDDGSLAIEAVLGTRTLHLALVPTRAPMPCNGDGILDIPGGGHGRYYSCTRLETKARLSGDATPDIAMQGQSWWDHEWGDFGWQMRAWDWFGLQMEDGRDLCIYRFRASGPEPERVYATQMTADGRIMTSHEVMLDRTSWWKSPRTSGWFVTGWHVAIPHLDQVFDVEAITQDQEMPREGPLDLLPAYWEGSVRIKPPLGRSNRPAGLGYSEQFPHTELSSPR